MKQEPLQMTKLPEGPWKEVSADFCGPFKTGEYLLVVIDEYSRFPEVEIVMSTSSKSTIPKLDAIFARQGIPETLKTDNGPPFNSGEFARWADTVGFKHRKIMPLWPQANGEAERFMRTLGKAVKTAMVEIGSWKQQLYQFLRHYRATPHSTTGVSPAMMLNGRKLRTELPVVHVQKKVRFQDQENLLKQRDERLKEYMKGIADEKRHSEKSNISEGDRVLIKSDEKGKLVTPYRPEPYEVVSRKHSMITAQRGNHQVTRNTSFFKKIPGTCGSMPPEEDEITDTGSENTAHQELSVQKPSVTEADEQLSARRSTREHRAPRWMEDYVK